MSGSNVDHLTAGLGGLRVSGVQEFVPASQRQAQLQAASTTKPNAGAIKEFVPGKGLVSSSEPAAGIKEFVPGKGLVDASQLPSASSAQQRINALAQGSQPSQGYQQQMPPQYSGASQMVGAMGAQMSVGDEGVIHGLVTGRSTLHTLPKRRTLRNVFLPDDLRSFFAAQARMSLAALEPDDPIIKELPRKFHTIYPLDMDPSQRNTAGSTGYPSCAYKAISSRDGFTYTVRRVDNVRQHGNLHQVLSMWSKVVNANVVPLRELFSQNRALFLVHDYVPGAQTLRDFILARGAGALLPENVIWSIVTQILSGVRAVHNAGMACRDLGPSRVLLTGRHRAKLACAGVVHALEPSPSPVPLADQQFEDLLWVGRLTICLSTMSLQGLADLQSSIQFMQNRYSNELISFALHPFKLQHANQRCNIYDLLALASQALLAENDALYAQTDGLEEHLARMYDCDRMFRLMSKMSLICERPPPPGVKPADSWSETDDRYVIKLFRDYVFHQVDDRGKPVVDFGHVIDCLNKLDAGSHERLLLAARDGKSFLVVSYEDVRICVDKAFHELFQQGAMHAHE